MSNQNMRISYSSFRDYITNNLKIITLILPMIIYFVGYLKYFVLLRKLEIYMPVNDIFSILSIFVSGISIMISYAYVPFFVLCILLWIDFCEQKRNINKLKYKYLGGIILCICNAIPLLINDFLLTPFNLSPLLSLAIMISIIYIIKLFKKLIWKTLLAVFLIWIICISFSYYISLPSSNDTYYNLDINSNINQDSGISGYMTTKYIISPDSVESNFNFETEKCYSTYGILLSSHEGSYYFYTNKRIYIIPNDGVILFDQFLHTATR